MHPTEHAAFAAALEAAKLQALYNFAYGLSHEINNPLANIAARAQALLVDETDHDRRRKLATIVQQAFRAHEMIADLMLFARPPALVLQPVDLVQLADLIVAEMQPQAREQGTQLSRSGASGPLAATADPTQLAVALKALVQNALEAVKSGGAVEISVEEGSGFGVQGSGVGGRVSGVGSRRRDDASVLNTQHSVLSTEPGQPLRANESPSVIPSPHFPNPQSASRNPQSQIPNPQFLLSVSDTGPGIPPEIRPHIFDPFFSGREAGRGLGLGLSKAWRIAELHGGTIEVESGPEGGARLTILIGQRD
jgi:signal transduction histidine kinase